MSCDTRSVFKVGTQVCTHGPKTKIASSPLQLWVCAGLGTSIDHTFWCNERAWFQAAVPQVWAHLSIIFPSCDCPLKELPLSTICPKAEMQLRDDKCVTREQFTYCINVLLKRAIYTVYLFDTPLSQVVTQG